MRNQEGVLLLTTRLVTAKCKMPGANWRRGPESGVMSSSPQLVHYPHLLRSIQNEILLTAGFQLGLVLFAIQITLLAAPRNSNKQKD